MKNLNGMNRREFVRSTLITAGGMALPLSTYGKVFGANDTIRIGIIGIGSNIKIGGKGKGEIREFSKIPGVQIAAICDCDSDILKKEEEEFKKINNKKPKRK